MTSAHPPPTPPPLPTLTPTPGELAHAQRRGGRSALVGLGLVGLVALTSPVLGYVEDVRNAREELLSRLLNQAQVQSEALGVHLGLLEAELARVAGHPALYPENGVSPAELALLESAFSHSTLFSEGVALLTPAGERVWSDPPDMPLGRSPLTLRPWFRRMVEGRQPEIDLLEGEGGPIVVAVPMLQEGRVKGVLLGELRASALPTRPTAQTSLVLMDDHGQLLMPLGLTLGAGDTTGRLRALADMPGPLTLDGKQMLGAGAWVGKSDLLFVVLEEETATAGLRARFLRQLAFHIALLSSTLIIFILLLRHSYRSLLGAEERLRRQETMAALGTAASLIAHEVKNALNGIQAALSVLRHTPAGSELPVGALRSQVERLSHLARSLLSFGAPRAALRRSCEVHLLVQDALQGVKLLPESEAVALTTSLEESLWVQGDAALLVSAIDNLLRNAVEAGAVAKDTGMQLAPWVSVRLTRDDHDAVLVVEDNAGGVDPRLEPRLWEPFATGRAKGVGLGLPMARASVEAHGGSLNYVRSPLGSRFTLRLPLEVAR
ncbi:sensor histidine kinase [Myxococcus sp. AM001]|uniref:sensor histidine kinase n=2 Tax=unclassified Myxococcus TaxID=2648731 RepID=UPI0015959A0A|nr:PAS domain-containing sensor histidine kinase [Myxococcus sp. AM010]NVJ06755.1 sensor histidine kinase [Myxococcus sp. AM001]NVJ18256.1 sensor histidine kinase [Myxococcus sp. AM010]